MTYKEFLPNETLRAFVKCYYLSEYDTDTVVQDKAFATGSMELMFNLGNGSFQTGRDGIFETTPRIELWGQIINPLDFKSIGKNKMLGIRFHPHTASVILGDNIDVFNDRVSDFADIAGAEIRILHERLSNTQSLDEQLHHLESFLMKKLVAFQKKNTKFGLVNSVITEIRNEDFCDDVQSVAFRYGISSRYLQKLFIQFTGLSPKLYFKINRFQRSLVMAGAKDQTLTSIAYQSGYFDQSHFIRDFKLFTGLPPSSFDVNNSSAILASSAR
jgi:AraC-like DNA-binding protein